MSDAPHGDPLESLAHAVEHAAHLLPSQGPISVFVHHNTLHAFEDRPFERAVREAGELYGCRPLLEEDHYQRLMVQGRFRPEHLAEVLREDLGEGADAPLDGLGTRLELRLAMLQHPPLAGSAVELQWLLAETDALRRLRPEVDEAGRAAWVARTRDWFLREVAPGHGPDGERLARRIEDLRARFGEPANWEPATWETAGLELLWALCGDRVERLPAADLPGVRRPTLDDAVEHATGTRPSRAVDEFLIPFLCAYLDQGFAGWTLPDRDRGLLTAFRQVHGRAVRLPRWLRGLPEDLRRTEGLDEPPLRALERALRALGLEGRDAERHVQDALLELRGFAGMIHQLETVADWVPRPVPPGTLVEYLVLRLTLQRHALRDLQAAGPDAGRPLPEWVATLRAAEPAPEPPTVEQRAYRVFQLAPLLGWDPGRLAALDDGRWADLVRELEEFDAFERRRTYHQAYERRFRNRTLDAVLGHRARRRAGAAEAPAAGAVVGAHDDAGDPSPHEPAYQVLACIDDREESLRRHLEEVDPHCETVGVAGFFGVAMFYRGATEAYPRPLCPVNVHPDHHVHEEPTYSTQETSASRARLRSRVGQLSHRVHRGSHTLLGGMLTAVLGSLATLPMLLRVFFPRHLSRAVRQLGILVQPPGTRLVLHRPSGTAPGPDAPGYTHEEMADVVAAILGLTGLTRRLSPLVVVLGHGSSSLNNPHRAAYDCGACGGGRGGPNGRAFAEMANDPRVRELLAERGTPLPEGTWFVGGYHNTGDDSITLYDLDDVPSTHLARLDRARRMLDEARARDAHERCRRFVSAPLDLGPREALAHVEGRTEDLSQTRPELGHATNALCFVGRRAWSRGLFLDRRAFLTSYDPGEDDAEARVLERLLQAVIPVCAGINLEYFFSYVDPEGYGCGTKLPHNLVGLLGVMSGAASDLRTGLPWQMVEVHEPLRILFLVETRPELLAGVLARNPQLDGLVRRRWVQLAVFDDATGAIQVHGPDGFRPYAPGDLDLPLAPDSAAWYRGHRGHLEFASIHPAPARPDRTEVPA